MSNQTSQNAVVAVSNGIFRSRMKLLALFVANSVMNEVGTTPNHANRLVLAQEVFLGRISDQTLCSWVVMDATVQTAINADPSQTGVAILDSDLVTALNNIWNNAANATVAVNAMPNVAMSG